MKQQYFNFILEELSTFKNEIAELAIEHKSNIALFNIYKSKLCLLQDEIITLPNNYPTLDFGFNFTKSNDPDVLDYNLLLNIFNTDYTIFTGPSYKVKNLKSLFTRFCNSPIKVNSFFDNKEVKTLMEIGACLKNSEKAKSIKIKLIEKINNNNKNHIQKIDEYKLLIEKKQNNVDELEKQIYDFEKSLIKKTFHKKTLQSLKEESIKLQFEISN